MQSAEMPKSGGTVAKWLAVREQLPEIRDLGDLRAMSTVYYPIALLRMKLEEYSFEDFSAVEQSILRFYSAGVTRAEELCKWMALPSARYVGERIALLAAEGLIEDGRLTALGRESLQEGRKKKLYDAEQIFQADAVTGLLLPKEYQVREDHLIDRAFTTGMIPHLVHSESIATDTIRKAIEGLEKIRSYKRYRKTILNVNVDRILDAKLASIRYIKALMVWPACSRVPMMFLPYYGRNETDRLFRCDMPLFIPESLEQRLRQLSSQTEVISDLQLTSLAQLYGLILTDQNGQELDSVREWLRNHTAFDIEDIDRSSGRIILNVGRIDSGNALSPLELEMAAALGASSLVPVEAEMEFGDNNYRKRITLWPYTDFSTDDERQLSQCWSQFSGRLCRMAPISLRDALAFVQEKKKREN